MNDIAFLDATAQAELVRTKQVSPADLVNAAIDRIEKLNPQLNAVVTPMFEEARRAAGTLPEGPFKGVPFLLKDLGAGAGYAGVKQAQGSAFLKDFVSPMDGELVARYKRAGLVICGKTNTPEFGLVPTTEPKLFGPSRNPWDVERSTGGSSGGSAAAVASGMVPFAHANDGGGSIRIPASCCGLFGLKPTRGRITFAPLVGDILGGLINEHAVTRSVRDSAALLDATAGPAPGDPYYAAEPERPYLEEVGRDPGKLRIAMTKVSATASPIHADNVAAVESAAKLCEELGHEVEEASPPMNSEQLVEAFQTVWAVGATLSVEAMVQFFGLKANREDFEPLTWALYEQGKDVTGVQYLMAQAGLQMMARQIAFFHQRYDLWLTPTLASPPPKLGYFDSTWENPMMGFEKAIEYVPFTPIQNVTGQPAMSVPLHWNAEGLPIGVHFVARYGDEGMLFRLASQLEEARPWAGRIPPVSA